MAEPAAFSSAARAVLQRGGWTDDYVCPALEEYCQALVEDGYEVSGAAREFMRRFGGLEFWIPLVPVPGVLETFHTRADDAVARHDPETAEDWSETVGAPLCLVGGVYGDHMALLMDRGRVFACHGVIILHLGDSGVEAVERLCTGAGYPWPKIGYPYDEIDEAPAERRPHPSPWDRLREIFRTWEK